MNAMESLPIWDIESDITSALERENRLIIEAPTASGKSTQVPQMLLDKGLLGDGQIMVLQPRRLAARLLASYVARQRGARLGDEVGFQIRFEDVSSPSTRIKYVTEGILLRRMLRDSSLDGVSAIVFDEFHERHVFGDVTLAQALCLQEEQRMDLKLIVMSATMDVDPIREYMAPCPALQSEGRTFPVDIEYLPRSASSDEPIWELATRKIDRLFREGLTGDVLVFMPGAHEIHRTIRELQACGSTSGAVILPLHGELPHNEQDAAVDQYNHQKIIVSTNVAETSLTINGVQTVIDSGLARVANYDPRRGINTLLIDRINQASADQRAGRAGRTAPGKCLRLWTEPEHSQRPRAETPEILRLDVSEIALTLKAAGVDDLTSFRWLSPPDPGSLERSLELLTDLGALSSDTGAITALGRKMLAFPVHPRYARMLIESGERKCVRAIALVAALTQGRDLFQRRQGKEVKKQRAELFDDRSESDFFRLMQAWHYAMHHQFNTDRCRRYGIHAQAARQVAATFDSFIRIAEREGLPVDGPSPRDEDIQKCILVGFADHLGKRLDGGTLRCDVVHDRRGDIDRESAVRDHDLVVAADIQEIEGRDVKVIMSMLTAVEESWLDDLFPGEIENRIETEYDPHARSVSSDQQRVFRGLVLEHKRVDAEPEEAANLLAREIAKGELRPKSWSPEIDQWFERISFLAEHCADLGFTEITDDDKLEMLQQFCLGSTSYKQIKDKPIKPVIDSWLSAPLRPLVGKYAPTQITLPAGKRAKVKYGRGQPPRISKRIQDLYGLKESPRVAMDRVPVVVEILGPNMRPVQTTQDLRAFWSEAYPKIKQELRRKYPKHEWR